MQSCCAVCCVIQVQDSKSYRNFAIPESVAIERFHRAMYNYTLERCKKEISATHKINTRETCKMISYIDAVVEPGIVDVETYLI